MKIKFIGLLIIAIFAAGCNLNIVMDSAKQIDGAVPIISDAADTAADAVVAATGREIVSADTAGKIENVSNKIATGSGVAKTGAEIITGFLPADKKPIGNALIALLGLLSTGAIGTANWFRKRKNLALKTAVIAADKTKGGGQALVDSAVKTGIAVEVSRTRDALK